MQHNATKYFALARTEEMAGLTHRPFFFTLLHSAQVLIAVTLKLCAGQPAKIQKAAGRISLPDESLIAMVHSYGPLSDEACQLSLLQSLSGELPAVLT